MTKRNFLFEEKIQTSQKETKKINQYEVLSEELKRGNTEVNILNNWNRINLLQISYKVLMSRSAIPL